MTRTALALLMGLVLLLTGCWDRTEVEDMLFPVTLGIDAGTSRAYRVTVRVPLPGGVRSGVLGGQGGSRSGEILSAESDSVSQAILIINTSVARRMTLRHMRSLIVGEDLARRGLDELFAEMRRNGEIRQTVAFTVARGRAADVLKAARFTGETNPAKVPEGMLIVEKYLHLAPPIRLHHMINRASGVGIDPFAPVVAINPRIGGQGGDDEGTAESESSLAGELERFDGNPVEVAGSAIFRGVRLVGYLTVDETQALLALRGEMGKAYMTFPHPEDESRRVLMRFQQENKPMTRVALTPAGARGTASLLFEGEVLSEAEDYRDPAKRDALEESAAVFMTETARHVLEKLRGWGADPVGFGLKVRRTFRTWSEWKAFGWAERVGDMEIRVSAKMRVRRFGLVMGSEQMKK